MNERLWANVLSGLVGVFFTVTLTGMLQHDSTVAGIGFLMFVALSALRWKFWHDEGE